MTDDDEIPVDPVDASYMEAEVELTITGMRGAVIQVLNTLQDGCTSVGHRTMKSLASGNLSMDDRGDLSSAVLASYVLNEAGQQIDWQQLEDIPDGMRHVDFEDLENLVDVAIEEVEDS